MRPLQQPANYDLTFETVNGISYYISKHLLEGHGILVTFTTRIGGVSRAPYSSLNLAFHVGDDPELVLENREIVCNLFGLEPARIVCAEQVHSNEVAIVTKRDIGKGALSLGGTIKGVDALVTDQRMIPLSLYFADCVPVILVELQKRIVSVIHGGWRGIYGNIIGNAAKTVVSLWPEHPAELLAFIGPSIGDCCFQVGEDLARTFSKRFRNSESWLHGDRIDLREIARMQLVESGVPAPNIYACEDCCTSCHNDSFFSYRADGGTTGRQAAMAAILRKPNSQVANRQ